MKNFNLIKTGIILSIMMAFGFVSCSNDDDIIEPKVETITSVQDLKGTWEVKELSTDSRDTEITFYDDYIYFGDFKTVRGRWSLLSPKGMNLFENISVENNVVYGKLQLSNGAIERYRKLNLNEEMIDLAENWSKSEKEIFEVISLMNDTLKIRALSRDGKSYIEETLTKKIPIKIEEIKTETLKGTWYSNTIKDEDIDIRWVINIDNDRMDKYIQTKNGDIWEDLKVTFFTCYGIEYSNRIINGKVISRLGALSDFLSLGSLSIEWKKILEQRKQEHDVLKIIGFEGEKLKMKLLEKEESQELTFEKGKQIEMLEIKTSWK